MTAGESTSPSVMLTQSTTPKCPTVLDTAGLMRRSRLSNYDDSGESTSPSVMLIQNTTLKCPTVLDTAGWMRRSFLRNKHDSGKHFSLTGLVIACGCQAITDTTN